MTMNEITYDNDAADLIDHLPFLKELEGKHIFITGGTGLIGRTLLSALHQANEKYALGLVIGVLVRDKNKYKEQVGADWFKNTVVVEGNLESLNSVTLEKNFDTVIHMASPTGSFDMANHPVKVINGIVSGTQQILDFAVKNNASSFLFLSTMEIYGPTTKEDGDIVESFGSRVDLSSVRSSYPEAKRLAEVMANSYGFENNMKVMTARLTQTFGPGVSYNDQRMFADFGRRTIENEKIVLHTKGDTVRSYIDVKDAVAALLYILLKGQNMQAYNVANSDATISVADFARKMLKIGGRNPEVDLVYDLKDAQSLGYAPVFYMKLATEKMENLGWKPEFSIDEMIERLLISMGDNA